MAITVEKKRGRPIGPTNATWFEEVKRLHYRGFSNPKIVATIAKAGDGPSLSTVKAWCATLPKPDDSGLWSIATSPMADEYVETKHLLPVVAHLVRNGVQYPEFTRWQAVLITRISEARKDLGDLGPEVTWALTRDLIGAQQRIEDKNAEPHEVADAHRTVAEAMVFLSHRPHEWTDLVKDGRYRASTAGTAVDLPTPTPSSYGGGSAIPEVSR